MICACSRGEAVMKGVCRACWAAQLGTQCRVRFWTPALHTELRLAYARRKKDRAAAIDTLQRKTGWPRHAIWREARRLGLDMQARRPWTKEDDRLLSTALGELPVEQIAGMLRRTPESVKHRAKGLELSTRIREGFCLADLARVFGVPRYRIDEWIERGLLGKPARQPGAGVRVNDGAVTGFIKAHPELIDFRLADQTFLKGVLYGAG